MKLSSGERVEIRDVLLVALADQVIESVLVGFKRSLSEVVLLVGEIQFECSFGVDWFETHGLFSRVERIA